MKELKFFVCTHCGNLAGMVYSSGEIGRAHV